MKTAAGSRIRASRKTEGTVASGASIVAGHIVETVGHVMGACDVAASLPHVLYLLKTRSAQVGNTYNALALL